jgi:hypothetical protein
MLRSVADLEKYALEARDGTIGHCRDFLFDDISWTIRYMVADTGNWMPGRKVLLSPDSLGSADWSTRRFHVALDRKEIEESPSIESDRPVSREREAQLSKHFGWAPYWVSLGTMGPSLGQQALDRGKSRGAAQGATKPADEGHLRSTREVTGYHIHARDGKIGHVGDFIVDDANWVIRYVVVDTHELLPGRKVLIVPKWVESINWSDQIMELDLERKLIEHGPVFDPTAPVNRRDESRLYDYYGRPAYWE